MRWTRINANAPKVKRRSTGKSIYFKRVEEALFQDRLEWDAFRPRKAASISWETQERSTHMKYVVSEMTTFHQPPLKTLFQPRKYLLQNQCGSV